MKIMVRAAMAALSFASISPAIAEDGGDPAPNTFFTQLPGVIAQAPAQAPPSVATAQNAQGVQAEAPRAGQGPWLVPPIGKYLIQ
jgi:hypothetical protein